jgi:hypothetical protein
LFEDHDYVIEDQYQYYLVLQNDEDMVTFEVDDSKKWLNLKTKIPFFLSNTLFSRYVYFSCSIIISNRIGICAQNSSCISFSLSYLIIQNL